jgi:hypothetical protein
MGDMGDMVDKAKDKLRDVTGSDEESGGKPERGGRRGGRDQGKEGGGNGAGRDADRNQDSFDR